MVSSLVHELLVQTGEFVFEEADQVELKGIDGPQEIYRLISVSADQRAPTD